MAWHKAWEAPAFAPVSQDRAVAPVLAPQPPKALYLGWWRPFEQPWFTAVAANKQQLSAVLPFPSFLFNPASQNQYVDFAPWQRPATAKSAIPDFALMAPAPPATAASTITGLAWWRPFAQPAISTALRAGQQQAEARLLIPSTLPPQISGAAWFTAFDPPVRSLPIQHQMVPGWPTQVIVTATIQENEWLIRARRRGRR
jgi:hypothetical protein